MNGILPPIGHSPRLPYVTVSGLGGGGRVAPGYIPCRDPGQGTRAVAAATRLALPERRTVQMEPG